MEEKFYFYLRNFGGKRFEDVRTSLVAGVQVATFIGVSCGSLNGSIVYTLVLDRDRINTTRNPYYNHTGSECDQTWVKTYH